MDADQITHIIKSGNQFRITTDHFVWYFVGHSIVKVKIDELMYTLVEDGLIDFTRVEKLLIESEFTRLMNEFHYTCRLVAVMMSE
jgi:hypothetical protein